MVLLLLQQRSVLLLIFCVFLTFRGATSADQKDDSIFDACAKGNYELVQDQLKKNPELATASTPDGETALHLCAIPGSIDIARILLKNGANPNARSIAELGQRMHPLSWHVYGGYHEIVGLLLKHGANVNDDFDQIVGGAEKRKVKVTVLDIIEQYLTKEEDDPSKYVDDDHYKTYQILLENGAKKYQE